MCEETWISQNDTDRSGVKEGVGKRPTFNIQHSTSNIQHPTFNIQHSTSNIQHSTSNIQHPTSKEGRVGKMSVVHGILLLVLVVVLEIKH
jgi:hypothetical protein